MSPRPSSVRGRRDDGPHRTPSAADEAPCGRFGKSDDLASPTSSPCCARLLKEPEHELAREECESTSKDNSRDLSLRPCLAKHEHQASDDDGNECQRSSKWACERHREIYRGTFPGALSKE